MILLEKLYATCAYIETKYNNIIEEKNNLYVLQSCAFHAQAIFQILFPMSISLRIDIVVNI